MPRASVIAFSLFALIASSVAAQSPTLRFLVPVHISLGNPAPGANGSLWVTELTVRNSGVAPVRVNKVFPDCYPVPCGERFADVPPNQTALLSPEGDFYGPGPGAIIEIASGAVEDVTFNLRAQDLSRQALTWGTQLPVVKDSEFLSGRATLVNVPSGGDFRHTLRIYEIDGVTNAEVELRLYSTDPIYTGVSIPPKPDVLLGSKRFPLTPPQPGGEQRAPAYLQLSNLNEIAEVGDAKRLVVQVVPVTAGMRYWAFISVTNNETQHVTTVLP